VSIMLVDVKLSMPGGLYQQKLLGDKKSGSGLGGNGKKSGGARGQKR
jgi:hypothetical protein